MTGKGLAWTAAHLRTAASPEDVRTAIAEAAGQLGDAPIPASTALSLIETIALDAATMRSELRSATHTREVLLASVAHDLRNPLNTFAMSAGLLREDLESPQFDRTRALSLLSRMDRASIRMQGLIADLLEASRVEGGTIEVTPRHEQAATIARAAITKARPLALDKGASLEEGPIAEGVSVMLDGAHTVEALTKLVAVSLKSAGEGGIIRIGVELADDHVLFTVRMTLPSGSSSGAPYDEARGGHGFVIARGLLLAQGASLDVETHPDAPRVVVTFPRSDRA
jgi:signal transduction histidine kinase